MSDSYPLIAQSWSDVFRALRTQAEATRGTMTCTPDAQGKPGAPWPRTTGADVLAICAVFDDAILADASDRLAERWIAESDLVATETPETLHDTYVGNRSFWATLALAVVELDRAQSTLPTAELWQAAVHELAAERRPVPPRNAGGEPLVTMFSERTWRDMAERQLMFFRIVRGESDAESPIVPRVPRTCNCDVLELARYWTEQLARIGQHPTDTYHRIVYSCWREVLAKVGQHAKRAPAQAAYAHNAEFWSALVLLTTQSDACSECPTPWAFTIRGAHELPRNATPVDQGPTLDFPDAKTWDEAAQMQRDALAKQRGVDVVPGGRGMVTRIPRTTVSDVRQLAAYWTIGLARVGEHNFADISYKTTVKRWKDAVDQVWAVPASTAATAVYPHNAEFWLALMTIAIQVGVTSEAPTRWQLAKEALSHSIDSLPETLNNLPQTLAKAVEAGGSWLSGALAKPLLYVGGGVVGITALLYLLRRPARPDPSQP